MNESKKNVVLLAGGIGGAKLAEGLSSIDSVSLSIIGNIADDDVFHGLSVSPDIDTLTYTLSGQVNQTQGWGVKGDQYRALSVLEQLGAKTWMSLGDSDFGLHIYRTERLRNGDRPSLIAKDIAAFLGVKAEIILPTDQIVRTKVKSVDGWMSFQEYFVEKKCVPEVLDICYEGIEDAKPTDEAIRHLKSADALIIAPSNPLLSIAPILNIRGIKGLISESNAPKLAVSPLIAGKAVKGPAIAIMNAMGMTPSSLGVAEYYKDLVDLFVIDSRDANLSEDIKSLGLKVEIRSTLMKDYNDKKRLSKDLISIVTSYLN
ncbi:MAG: 2-phospho-L-lactate transferase [Pseudomonadota bacterium]|nr:2-phospho-L-lactate transferase [Pseudomonadota bacterium]